LLAVPGVYSEAQLGLLLGIGRACDMPVTGLVDSALAALDGLDDSGPVLHLDVRLHRAVLTLFDADSRRMRRSVESVETAGLLAFHNAWARELATRFVRETRFDPLHRARSEQALYDALPGWLERICANGASVISIESKGGPRSIEVDGTQATAIVASQLDAILEASRGLLRPSPANVALSARAARIPGLASRMEELTGHDATVLDDGRAVAGALRRRALIEEPGQKLPLVLALPFSERHG
jgi:hypothetical protein